MAGEEKESASIERGATGPRTPQGKERSKHNALKHGIFSNLPFLHGGSKAQFDSLLNGLREYLKPVGTLEEVLVEKLATIFWRYRRLLVAQGTELPTAATGILEFKQDFTEMDRLLRYEANLDRSLERTLKQLERLQGSRLGLAVPPSIDVNISS